MFLIYLFVGFIVATIAAAPPGAANIVVINTSMNNALNKAFIIALGAGLGEVMLSLIALHCTMSFTDYFKENPWIQISVFSLFILVGLFFLLRKKLRLIPTGKWSKKLKTPQFVTGWLLAFLNPPVLLFWVLAFTIIHKHVLLLSDMSPALTLLLFFAGVYFGKVLTLYAYGKWGKKLKQHEEKGHSVNKKDIFVGVALMLVGAIQGIRFFIH